MFTVTRPTLSKTPQQLFVPHFPKYIHKTKQNLATGCKKILKVHCSQRQQPIWAFFFQYGYKIYAGEATFCIWVEKKSKKNPDLLTHFPLACYSKHNKLFSSPNYSKFSDVRNFRIFMQKEAFSQTCNISIVLLEVMCAGSQYRV